MKPARLTTVRLEESADIVRLRDVAMALTKVLNFNTFEHTRTVTAIVELGRNAIEHGCNGRASFSLTEIRGRPALALSVLDQGRGIPSERLDGDVAPGTSGGLGLGLRGVQRIADQFHVETGGEGTKITVSFRADAAAVAGTALVQEATDALQRLEATDPVAALAEQNRKLLEALADRDMILKELHHRTGNNLAMISALIRMTKSHSASDETRTVLGQLETRVGALAKAHQLMQQASNAGTIVAEDLLRAVASNAERAFSTLDHNVQITVNCNLVELDGKLGFDIGLIVGELITNAYKHAFPGRKEGAILIALTETDAGGAVLTVSDNGIGFAPGNNPEASSSLGWQLIRALTFQHDATLDMAGEGGLSVSIAFPPPDSSD